MTSAETASPIFCPFFHCPKGCSCLFAMHATDKQLKFAAEFWIGTGNWRHSSHNTSVGIKIIFK
jgi:hypothetical protein